MAMTHRPLLARARPSSAARSDLAWVLAATVLTFVLSSALELQEQLAALAAGFEAWQADEIPLTLIALSFGLAWYAWRRRAEAAQLLAHNRELAHQLIAVQDSERLAVARELHDDLSQHCTAIRIEAAYIQRAQSRAQIAASAQRAAATAELLQHSVRRLLRRLRPAELDELGLVAAVQSLCEAWQQRSGVVCTFHHPDGLAGLGEAVEATVYRVAQEALSNVMRHAHAKSVRIELGWVPTGLELRVEDDGLGFDAGALSHGLGLLGATERAAALDGRLTVVSAPGAGTCVRMRLPLRASGPAPARPATATGAGRESTA